jgi:transcriptional regulator with XRE-family HTH domain
MSTLSVPELSKSGRVEYMVARTQDEAFDAVKALWRRRQAEGLTLKDLAERIDGDSGRLSKHLKGPSNWTIKTYAKLVAALGGEPRIGIIVPEDHIAQNRRDNYDVYFSYESDDGSDTASPLRKSSTQGVLSGPTPVQVR